MRVEMTDEPLVNTLMENPDGIARLFSSAANPSRVRMMALLIQGEQGLPDLIRVSGLSKNATVNHLTKLINMGIVDRVSRGRYFLTRDGRGLILAGASLFMDSFRQDMLDQKMIRQSHVGVGGTELNLDRRTVVSDGKYLSGWISFDGAVGGALRAQGIDCDLVDVAGRSGYAFLLNVPKGRICPSAPTSMRSSVYIEFVRGVSELGIGAEIWIEEGGYIGGETISLADLERARNLFQKVKTEIDRRGRPVVLWGLPKSEFGIVNGYEGDSYVASTFRSNELPENEELVPSLDIKAPEALMMVTFGGNAVSEERWLERAVLMASGKAAVSEGYLSGPKAAHEWSSTLLEAGDDQYVGNSHTAACYAEGLSNAEIFLKRMALRHHGEGLVDKGAVFKGIFLKDMADEGLDRLTIELMEAAAAYARGARSMEEYLRLFPFKPHGSFDSAARDAGSVLLLDLEVHEESALQHLQEALACRS